MIKKYELTKNATRYMGITLYQIRALTSFGDVREGDLGGFIESYDNLENDLEKGTAWIDKESKAFNNAVVKDYAKVQSSNIFDNAVVDGYARLKECEVSGNAVITDYADVEDCGVYGDAVIKDYATTYRIYAYENAKIEGYATVKGAHNFEVKGNTVIKDYVYIVASGITQDTVISGKRNVIDGYLTAAIADVSDLKIRCYEDLLDFEVKGSLEDDTAIPKYELIETNRTFEERPLFRIRALADFGDVKKGDFGGFVESERNLQNDLSKGTSWIYDDSIATGFSKVCQNAKLLGNSTLSGRAGISHRARIEGRSNISGLVEISGNNLIENTVFMEGKVKVRDNAAVCLKTIVRGRTLITDNAKVLGAGSIFGNAIIKDHATITPKCSYSQEKAFCICGDTIICQHATIEGEVEMYGAAIACGYSVIKNGATVLGNTIVSDCAIIGRKALLKSPIDLMLIPRLYIKRVSIYNSTNTSFTLYRTINNEIMMDAPFILDPVNVKEFKSYISTIQDKSNIPILTSMIENTVKVMKSHVPAEMPNDKYELTTEAIKLSDGTKCHRIRALRDFGSVKKGDLGGFVENFSNLENDVARGSAWLYDDSVAYGSSCVKENAKMHDKSIIAGNAVIKGNAEALDKAFITDTSVVEGSAWIVDKATVEGYSHIKDSAIIAANAIISDSIVSDYVCIGAYVKVKHDSKISGRVEISGSTLIDKSEIRVLHLV